MGNIYDAVTKAISAHWKAHDKKYPQKIVLSREQRSAFMRMRNLGRDRDQEINDTHFMGVAIEEGVGVPDAPVAKDAAFFVLNIRAPANSNLSHCAGAYGTALEGQRRGARVDGAGTVDVLDAGPTHSAQKDVA